MSHRAFIDEKGESWDVWLVLPTSAERRKVERRVAAGAGGRAFAGEERRAQHSDRRLGRTMRRPPIDKDYRDGWLCFESDSGEKRRLMPIPQDWERMSVPELLLLCSEAKRVVRCGLR